MILRTSDADVSSKKLDSAMKSVHPEETYCLIDKSKDHAS
jgi:hypothetical protein